MADTLSDLARNHPSDPDAQAAVTDFLDYTEFFPSDLFRSLTLIGKLDEDYKNDTLKVHNLTKAYGSLPTLPAAERPNPQAIRKDLSTALSHAIRCRESSHAEASRLYNLADGLYTRLVSIKKKLQTLPKPPSRDPSPIPQAKLPVANRNRKNDNEPTPRITLYTDGARAAPRTHITNRPRQRVRRIIVPGEVLPPYEDASPNASDSESDSERTPTPAIHLIRLADKTPAEKVLKLPKVTTIRIPRPPSSSSRVRPHGMMGTNVHSQVAGISVSNAMAILQPPPAEPIPGTKHAPWLKLTEWELNKLRKRMKKNADWVPSDTMVRRELAENKRGYENYLKAKAHSEATGEPLVNEEPEAFIRPVTYRGHSSPSVQANDSIDQLENRGMKLNQAKKLKKQTQLQEQVTFERSEKDHVAVESEDRDMDQEEASPAGSTEDVEMPTVGTITIKPREVAAPETTKPALAAEQAKEVPRSHKKRKHEAQVDTIDAMIDPALLMPSEYDTQPVQKKLKLGPPIVIPTSVAIEEVAMEITPDIVVNSDASEFLDATPSSAVTAASTLDESTKKNRDVMESIQTAEHPALEQRLPAVPAPQSTSPLVAQKARPVLELKAPKSTSRGGRTKPSTTPTPDSAPPAVEPSAFARPRSRGGAIISLTFNANKTKAASAEPPSRRASGRRASNVSLPSTQATPKKKGRDEPSQEAESTTRRARRPAPGLLASSDTTAQGRNGLQVILGKRKAAPARKGGNKPLTLLPPSSTNNKRQKSLSSTAAATPTPSDPVVAEEEEYYEGEPIDPDEPRYCLCNRVSYGTMVACENDACEKEWFHLGCVGLEDIPKRTAKWYCPECRVKLGVSMYGEPLSAAEVKAESKAEAARLALKGIKW